MPHAIRRSDVAGRGKLTACVRLCTTLNVRTLIKHDK
jgi:hypothetical protein